MRVIRRRLNSTRSRVLPFSSVLMLAACGSDSSSPTATDTGDPTTTNTATDTGDPAITITDRLFVGDANGFLTNVDLDGGGSNDTISNNTLTASDEVYSITFDGGAGNDIISDNHFESSGTSSSHNVYAVTLMGGAGNDVFRDNTATQANGESASMTLDGGYGEDTVVFRLNADQYTGAVVEWLNGETTTITGDGAAVTLIDIETLSFADGTAYTAVDAIVGNEGTTIDLASLFAEQVTSYTVAVGTVGGDNSLTLAGSELADGVNTLNVTAADTNGDAVIMDITINADKSPTVVTPVSIDVDGNGMYTTPITLSDIFGGGSGNLTYTSSAGTISGTNLDVSAVALSGGENLITITASDSDADKATTTITINADKSPTIATTLQDATVVGNDTIIDLDGVFNNGSGKLTLITSLGSIGTDNSLTLSDSVFTEGTHMIIITATDADGDKVEETVELISDKSPTIVTSISDDDTRTTNHSNTRIDLTTVFANGSGTLTYAVTASNGGAGVSIANSALTIDYATLGGGTHTVTVTATDSDADSITDVFVLELKTLNDNSLGSDATLTGTTLADAITGNSFVGDSSGTLFDGTLVNGVLKNVTLDGGAGNDTISNNTLTGYRVYTITFDGGAGNDTISNNTLTASDNLYTITFDGGAGNDTISNNTLTASSWIYNITLGGGDGNDNLSGNSLTANSYSVYSITFDGGTGDDTISSNTLTAGYVYSITFDGGAGNDTISSNMLTSSTSVYSITFDGGDGNDTISDNHFKSTGTHSIYDVYAVTLMGGAGDDVFSGNTATQANGDRSSITIDGGADTDKVYFELASSMFSITGAYGSNITVTDSAKRTGAVDSYAKYVLIDIEELYFDDTLYVFPYGSNTTIGATDLTDAITDNSFASYDLTNVDLDGGAGDDTISDNTLTASNWMLSITFDGGADNDTISNNTLTGSQGVAIITFDGGDGDDTISNNTLTAEIVVYSITFDGGDGVDTISNNTVTGGSGTYDQVHSIRFDGGDGDDTISSNTLTAGYYVYSITFAGGDGDDTISSNTLKGDSGIATITFDGGAGDDTISSNTFTGSLVVYSITLDGGAGNDTISDNHFEATGTGSYGDVDDITLMGGAGDDVFSGNSATQANGELSGITINGGEDTDGLDTDKVYFELASGMFDITGAYGSNITVTDKAARTDAVDGVDSYAEYVLIDIEELYFGDSDTPYVFS